MGYGANTISFIAIQDFLEIFSLNVYRISNLTLIGLVIVDRLPSWVSFDLE